MLYNLKTLTERVVNSMPLFKSALTLAALSAAILNAGCVPKEAKNTASAATEASVVYSGFAGLTSAQTMSSTKVKLTWTPSTDPTVKAYNIYDTSLLFSPKLIKTILAVPGQATVGEVTLLNLLTANLYSFRVRAINSNNIEDTNKVDLNAIPYAGAATVSVDSAVAATLSYPDASNADAARIYCQIAPATDWILQATINNPVAPVSPATTTSKQIVGLNAGSVYTCRVAISINGYEDNNTTTVSFTPVGTAANLVFSTQPGSAAAGSLFPQQPVITIKDNNGTVVAAGADSKATITLVLSSASPTTGTVRGTATVTAVKGVATFNGLYMAEAGIKILTATKSDTSSDASGTGSLPLSADSAQFTISSGTVSATKSTIAISPAVPPNPALVANGSNAYSVIITLRDENSNPISGVKPTFGTNISGDTLSQPTVASNASGVATGSISTSIADTTPARILNITSPSGLTQLQVAAPFVPGAAYKLAFTTQPVNSPSGPNGLSVIKVAIQDAQGNTVTTGSAASSPIGMTISANTSGATLTGTTSVVAVAGIATFSDLGISKTQTGYKLQASSGSYQPAFSNSFNVTAGVPYKIVLATSPTEIPSGTCSSAITLQLQDSGNNPANAIQNTPVNLSGLGSGAYYSSSTCAGTALTSSTTFTAGTATKTIYFKDLKAEGLTLTATDPSGLLNQASLGFNSAPDKISLLAQAGPPAANGVTLTVPAGRCSTGIVITPMGDNGVAGPIFTATTVAISGISGTSAGLYTDSTCQTPVASTSVLLLPALSATYTTTLYVKDPVAETLSLNVTDPNAKLTTTSLAQTVVVGASKIDFTGPSSVVSGACSTAFTIRLKDTLGNNVTTSSTTTVPLSIVGLSSSTGVFYTSPSCTGTPSSTSVTFPANVSQMQIYFKDASAENLSISLSDPAAILTTSQAVNIGVSPSALGITGPSAGTSKTTVCAGPFTLKTLDGGGHTTAAVTPITVTLSGAGSGGAFFTDVSCVTAGAITSFTFAQGDSSKTFYYQGEYPNASLTLTATDNANVLTAGTLAWSVTADKGFLGSAGSMTDANGNLYWFQKGFYPVAGRMDAQRSGRVVHLDAATKSYLYVVDPNQGRVLKFDYTQHKYIGWLGAFSGNGGIGVSGSNLSTPDSATCASTVWGAATPGWCVSGQAYNDGNTTTGRLNYPNALVDDGTYIYVASRNGFTISRYVAQTGAFAGWIGQVSTRPTASAAGNSGACTNTTSGPTPGWCIGGANQGSIGQPTPGTGYVNSPRALAIDGTYLYVGSYGAVTRYFLSDGSFQGWIGYISATGSTSGYTPLSNAACASQGQNVITNGWCMGGGYTAQNQHDVPGALNDPTAMVISNGKLYVMNTDYNTTISVFDVASGASGGILPLAYNDFHGSYGIATDDNYLYIADNQRLVKTSMTGVVQGWIGKVANNTSMSPAACAGLAINANTPGFCLGGTSKNGMEDGAFHNLTGVDLDGSGNVLTGQGDNFPAVKIFDKTSGVYGGTLAQVSSSPTKWANDANAVAGYYGFDDNSFYSPSGSWADAAGNYLYVTEYDAGRVKKIDLKTGKTIGWIGGITTTPTGGVNSTSCLAANPNAGSPGWCLGAYYQPTYMGQTFVNYNVDGVFNRPAAVVGDDQDHLFVVDTNAHKILKFTASTGAYIGWIGLIGTSPTGGDTGCNGAMVGTFTPGWCTGGASTNGSIDGALTTPGGITFTGSTLYVVDSQNHRVSSYDSGTGAFKGWIGGFASSSAAPTSGCTKVYNNQNYYSQGWCKGGTSAAGTYGGDRGGAFYMYWSGAIVGGITTDGSFLYVTNFRNVRIDKWSLTGIYQGSTPARTNLFTGAWVLLSNPSSPTPGDTQRDKIQAFVANNDWPLAITVDANYIYGTTNWFSSGGNAVVWKMNKSTGAMIGWQGGISYSNTPTGGGAGCNGAQGTTPSWCQGGSNNYGFRLGYFTDGVDSISVDANYIYATDVNSNRVTRIPK